MFVPVTREDFAKVGRRFSSEEIVNETDRLIPMATADLSTLETGGYSRAMLDELVAFRDQLRAESAAKSEVRGAKKGARMSEGLAFKEGRLALRKGISMALVAISRRQVPAGEDPKTTQERVTELTHLVKALGGKLNNDPAVLRARLEGLRALLGQPDFAPAQDGEPARKGLIEKLDRAIGLVTTHAEAKKNLKERSKGKTMTLDELDGRAYTNLRLLSQVGRACFMDAGDQVRAEGYLLRRLNRNKKDLGQEPKPAQPEPKSPGPSSPLPVGPIPAPVPVG
ncbi:MAG TPA: hypothetical protein PK668_12680 [Myxococcota bacterium]|nr:hypothetical protein [Myxococcota bacterium]HRY93674.1 hypothetical protein [Myxococcota bacterium]